MPTKIASCSAFCDSNLLVQGVLPADRLSAIAHLPVMVELLEFILVRDPNRRPPLSEVIRR